MKKQESAVEQGGMLYTRYRISSKQTKVMLAMSKIQEYNRYIGYIRKQTKRG